MHEMLKFRQALGKLATFEIYTFQLRIIIIILITFDDETIHAPRLLYGAILLILFHSNISKSVASIPLYHSSYTVKDCII